MSDVTRDQKTTQQAMDALGELTRRYPESRYAADARLKMDLVRDHLAGKEMEIGRFYERTGQYLAAIIRYRKVTEEYDTTSHVPERSEEHKSEIQSLMRISYAVLCLKKKNTKNNDTSTPSLNKH